MTAMIATGPADLRDQRWLDERIEAIEDGIESVLDIARNWSDGRNLARLHPDTSAQTYILARVKSPLGRGVVEPLLAESNWSNRQIAAVAGVDEDTVREQLRENPQLERPAKTLGADGKLRPSTRPAPFRPRLDPTPDPYFTERVVRKVTAEVIETVPVDSALWLALSETVKSLRSFSEATPTEIANAVPERRRAGTAKTLRQLGTFLGAIALELEGMN